METTFDNLIERLDNLMFEDWIELENILPLATEFIKRKFPDDFKEINERITSLNFTPQGGSNIKYAPRRNPIEVWKIAVSTFRGIIQAQKENYEEQFKGSSNIPESVKDKGVLVNAQTILELKNNNDEITKLYNAQISEHQNEINLLIREKKDREQVNEKLKKTIEELKEENNQLLNNYNIEKNRNKSIFSDQIKINFANTTHWSIITAFIFGFFGIGYYFGNNRFDSEKLSMRDTIISLKTQNLILKDSLHHKKISLK
ncbi:hypothetical protein [Mucilaginibacter sp.]|uniref:hypothetical protein n=1 Tax=Mucilaginibacter sp. TaxID=1882438 RepID=UPI003D09C65B